MVLLSSQRKETVSARRPDLTAPLSLLALLGASGALVAESKRRRKPEKSGLSEVQRRRQSKVEKRWKEEAERKRLASHRGMDSKIDRMEAAEMKNQQQYFKFSPKRRREAGDTIK